MRTHTHAHTSNANRLLAVILALVTASPLLASDQGGRSSRRGRRTAAQGSSNSSTSTNATASGQAAQTGTQAHQGQARGQGRGHGNSHGRAGGQAATAHTPSGHAQGHARTSSHVRAARARSVHGYGDRSPGYAVVRRGCSTPACAPYHVHSHSVVTAPRPYPVYYATAPASVETYVAPAPAVDRFDLGLGLGLAAASPQLQSGLPLLTGKLRALGQVTPHLGLGLDLDVSSLVLVNHATLSAVASYDLLGDSEMALRPYLSLGAGALNLITPEFLFVGPAVSARAGIEFKPWRWLGLSVEAGSVASMMNSLPLAVPYAGGTLALYLL